MMVSEEICLVLLFLDWPWLIYWNNLFLDMAEYTGAKERIALSKKSQKTEAKNRKATMAEMIEDAYVLFISRLSSCGTSIYLLLTLHK
jgi:hypothetical protein